MRLSVHELIRAKWTEEIHEEWIIAVLRTRPDLTRQQLDRTRELMDLHADDCLVEGYGHHTEKLLLPDLNDRHVLAAAIECGADAIVTWNVSDFPESVLREHEIELWTPDQLLHALLLDNGEAVVSLMREHRAVLRNPPKTVVEYLETLEQQRLHASLALLRDWQEKL